MYSFSKPNDDLHKHRAIHTINYGLTREYITDLVSCRRHSLLFYSTKRCALQIYCAKKTNVKILLKTPKSKVRLPWLFIQSLITCPVLTLGIGFKRVAKKKKKKKDFSFNSLNVCLSFLHVDNLFCVVPLPLPLLFTVRTTSVKIL